MNVSTFKHRLESHFFRLRSSNYSAANVFGEKIFLEEENNQLSFRDFCQHAHWVAAALISRGIEPGDRITVWGPNISEWVISALGAQCAGAILVTLNTRYKSSKVEYIL